MFQSSHHENFGINTRMVAYLSNFLATFRLINRECTLSVHLVHAPSLCLYHVTLYLICNFGHFLSSVTHVCFSFSSLRPWIYTLGIDCIDFRWCISSFYYIIIWGQRSGAQQFLSSLPDLTGVTNVKFSTNTTVPLLLMLTFNDINLNPL